MTFSNPDSAREIRRLTFDHKLKGGKRCNLGRLLRVSKATSALMLFNYLKVGVRNMLRHKVFSFINIFGLAVSMSVCMLIIQLMADQRSYDQFHVNKERIYRVETHGIGGDDTRTASSALPLAAVLRQDYPAVEASASLIKNIGGDLFYKEKIASGGGYFADENLFRVMDFKLAHGDVATALDKPYSMVISQELADLLFYKEDPIGKTVKFNDTGINPGGPETGSKETPYGEFMITGVLSPVPGKTTLPFKFLASLNTVDALTKDSILNYPPNNWLNVWSNYTYVLLKKGKTKADLQTALDRIAHQKYPANTPQRYEFAAVRITDLMPSDPISNATNIAMPKVLLVILSILCIVVMLSACLNYTNLSMARQLTRAKEVGIRKVSGATRPNLFFQFIVEAVLVSLFSLVLAVMLLFVLQKLFLGLWLNQYLNITFEFTPALWLVFIAFSIVVGIIAGLLPALYISMFDPSQILRGLNKITSFKRLTLRKMMLVVQSFVSLFFIISTSLIYLQARHVLNFEYGFAKEDIVNIKLFKTENYDRYVHAISNNKQVVAVGACTFPPATGNNNRTRVYKVGNETDSLDANYIDVDEGALNVWNLKILAGKNLPAIPAENDEQYVLINEKMVSDLKFNSARNAVGQHLRLGTEDVQIAGVIKDFHFLDVSRPMEPLMLRNRKAAFGYMTVRIHPGDVTNTMSYLEETWKKVNPSSKFEYEFFDQQLRVTHAMLSDVAGIIGILAVLALLISSLGLLGMSIYTVETRKKEISVRKLLGSGVPRLVLLLSGGFIKLLAIAILICVPAATIVNSLWLENFASRVSITPGILLIDTLVLLAISLLIVLLQAWRVSRANLASSLRSE